MMRDVPLHPVSVDALLALCAPGLEPFTARELRELGFKNLRPVPGGVLFHGGLRIYIARKAG